MALAELEGTAFVVLLDKNTDSQAQPLYARLWGSGFLPSRYQGTSFQAVGDPVLFLSNPGGVDTRVRRRMLDALADLNRKHLDEIGDPEIQTTIAQQEMAFRMQTSVPELANVEDEPESTFKLYGDDGVSMYEILFLNEEEGTLSLKVKHFNADFTAWEEKDEWVTFEAQSIGPGTRIDMNGLTLALEEGTLTATVTMRQRDGSVTDVPFVMQRPE